ncbi:MAG: DUF6599 family protein [Candidatus Zixiibacteriota bacterium]
MNIRYIILVNLIFVLVTGCGEQSDTESSGQQGAAKSSPKQVVSATAILPRTEELAGFEKVSDDRVFDAYGTLDYVGEDSLLFADYRVVAAASADYIATEADLQFAVDVFRFPGYSEAFGIYAHDRTPELKFVNVGTQGYIADGSLSFFRGDYYVKVSGYAASEDNDSAAVYLGMAAANRIDQKSVYPAAILLMPEEGKIINSEEYFPSKFLDHDFFSPAYACRYHLGDSVSTLVFMPRGSTAELLQYKEILTNRGNKVIEEQQGELRLYFCDDDRHGRVIMSSRAGRLAGVINTPDRILGMELLMKLWNNVDVAQHIA